jgi:hypothetical protein
MTNPVIPTNSYTYERDNIFALSESINPIYQFSINKSILIFNKTTINTFLIIIKIIIINIIAFIIILIIKKVILIIDTNINIIIKFDDYKSYKNIEILYHIVFKISNGPPKKINFVNFSEPP